jgi:hypothetical protein
LIAVSVLETILYFVVPSVGIYGLIALLVAGPKLARKQRYRVGQPWSYEPMFWTANPEGAHLPTETHPARSPCPISRTCRPARW